jgi:hypothetical protein
MGKRNKLHVEPKLATDEGVERIAKGIRKR